ncbi:hypothetical protein [Caulobacter hibisci]|uniref:Uncharacterized protein n=1 Tax=Caulobacter hibisci TaxID=2035993 RepID=A0ABS0SWP0_9CAUL|nr:hypothetical protein [Caulobacter hibisci]MBI1684003.1 hypothetical protein [Caulobacter hibisci]
MNQTISLTDLRDEMHRIATVMGAPIDLLANCDGPDRGGYRISLGADAESLRLTYSEKDDVDLLVESSDPAVVLEALFVKVTESWAPSLVEQGDVVIDPEGVLELLTKPSTDIGLMALAHHVSTSRVQEELLGRVDAAWRSRQSAKNLQRLQQIQDFFDK